MVDDPDQSKVTKEGARYTTVPEETRAPPDARCEGCAHFVPAEDTAIAGGLCKLVAGVIRPDAVCLNFYSDVGVFADNDLETDLRISSVLERGGLEDWSGVDVRVLAEMIADVIERRRTMDDRQDVFREIQDRADARVEDLGLGPGALPDRDEDDG